MGKGCMRKYIKKGCMRNGHIEVYEKWIYGKEVYKAIKEVHPHSIKELVCK